MSDDRITHWALGTFLALAWVTLVIFAVLSDDVRARLRALEIEHGYRVKSYGSHIECRDFDNGEEIQCLDGDRISIYRRVAP